MTRATLRCVLAMAAALTAVPASTSHAADHRDGPGAKGDPAADISDLFAFPVEGGRLVLAMALNPFAGADARFSDQVDYTFRIRRAWVQGIGAETRIDANVETRVTCRFDAGDEQWASCRVESVDAAVVGDGSCGPGCFSLDTRVGDEAGDPSSPMRVFAGLRADPFFSDVARVRLPRLRTDLPGDIDIGRNWFFETADVLAIVVELDIAEVLGGTGPGTLFAVAGETTVTQGGSR